MDQSDVLGKEVNEDLDFNDPKMNMKIAEELLEITPRVRRRIRDEMRRIVKRELTTAQLRILSHLSDENSTISELAGHHGVSAPAMSKMVSQLEIRKLVERKSDGLDRRHVGVTLTPEGKQNYLSIRREVRRKISEEIGTLGVEQKRAIFIALNALGTLYKF